MADANSPDPPPEQRSSDAAARMLPWDWYPGQVPENVELDPDAYLETTFSFHLYRSRAPTGVYIGAGAATYLGTMFDVGPAGQVTIGKYALVNGARIICDAAVEIGDYALISWNVVLMDSYRVPANPAARRELLRQVPFKTPRCLEGFVDARPVRIKQNVWIGFDACVLPGVTIGEGAVVGAKSVVAADVPPYSVVAGNPAVIIRTLLPGEVTRAR
jgi:acetyltransferase-like isoleucine patch superfamily enzyme